MKPGILLPYLKAVVAGVVAFAGGMGVAYVDGGLSPAELWTTIGATATAVGTVWGVPNLAAPNAAAGRHERGQINVGVSGVTAILVIVALCLIILRLLGADTRIF